LGVYVARRLAVIGRGTAGVMTVAKFLRYINIPIDWYFDENIKPQAVGEGSLLDFPEALYRCIGFHYRDLEYIDGSLKQGIYKEGWGDGHGFYHDFAPPLVAYHFNAVKFQEYILSKVMDHPNLRIIRENVKHEELGEYDYIMDCSGRPNNYDDFYISEFIPVNSVYVTQCYWDHCYFNYTLTLARPYGWVFGIPLHNRCSIGYMFNKDITDLEEVKEDVKQVFKQWNLTASQETNSFSFKNYYRKNNFSEKLIYNGNASFFLEPLEATSLGMIDKINNIANDLWGKNRPLDSCNDEYLTTILETEHFLMSHYAAGSKWNNKFWDFARERGERCIEKAIKEYPKFMKFVKESKKFVYMHDGYSNSTSESEYAFWTLYSFTQNLRALNMYDKIESIQQHIKG